MKYIICALALFLTACSDMSAKEIAGRKAYCQKRGAVNVEYRQASFSRKGRVSGVTCVFNGYETDSEYVEEKK